MCAVYMALRGKWVSSVCCMAWEVGEQCETRRGKGGGPYPEHWEIDVSVPAHEGGFIIVTAGHWPCV